MEASQRFDVAPFLLASLIYQESHCDSAKSHAADGVGLAGIATASAEPNRNKVGKVTRKQVLEIAKTKMADLNARNEDAASRIIMGTARSMGIDVVD